MNNGSGRHGKHSPHLSQAVGQTAVGVGMAWSPDAARTKHPGKQEEISGPASPKLLKTLLSFSSEVENHLAT